MIKNLMYSNQLKFYYLTVVTKLLLLLLKSFFNKACKTHLSLYRLGRSHRK